MHRYIFKVYRWFLSEWADWTDPNTTRTPKSSKSKDLRDHLIEFPYRKQEDVPMTKAAFDAMSNDEAFDLCFPGIAESESTVADLDFDIEQSPYLLQFRKYGMYGQCKYCSATSGCSGCKVPYSDAKTVEDCLQVWRHSTNQTLFDPVSYNRGKEFGLCITWNRHIEEDLFACLTSASRIPEVKKEGETEEVIVNRRNNAEATLADCFESFKQTETLDENNKWYCKKCKDHVQARKTMELQTVPRILIITLKRFKQSSGSRFGGGGIFGMMESSFSAGEKLESLIDFPLEGLDMAPYVRSESQRAQESLIYDCFAVSNHFGGTGGGHYTAFAKHPRTGEWYDFDDSCVSKVNSRDLNDTIVSSSAYSIFYRRRDNAGMDTIDFDLLAKEPNTIFLEQLEAKRKASKEAAEK